MTTTTDNTLFEYTRPGSQTSTLRTAKQLRDAREIEARPGKTIYCVTYTRKDEQHDIHHAHITETYTEEEACERVRFMNGDTTVDCYAVRVARL